MSITQPLPSKFADRMVGRSQPSEEAEKIVSGDLEYVTDRRMEGTLFGAVARATVPHGEVETIDVSGALATEGVVAVLTACDVPVNALGAAEADGPVLVDKRIRQVGDPLVLVAAKDEPTARAAAQSVRARVRQLPVVDSPVAALEQGAPALHDEGNTAARISFASGDVEASLSASELVVERRVHTPSQEHVAIEVPGGTAVVEGDVVTIWCGSQNPGLHRRKVARALNIDIGDVRLVSNPVGGAFGARNDDPMPVYLALLARATLRPVHMKMSREEVMAAAPKRHPFDIDVRVGFGADGAIRASEMKAVADTGPYVTSGPNVLKTSAEMSTGPYRMPAAGFDGRVVYTNNANAGAFRGYGVPQVAYALETALTDAAFRLGLDPAELRARNLLRGGEPHALYGHAVTPGLRAVETLRAAAGHTWWRARRGWQRQSAYPWRRGTGIAMAMKGVGMGGGRGDAARARLIVARDGTVRIWAGPNHTGQAIGTTYRQIATDTLGMAFDDITVTVGDSQLVPESGATAASRSTYAGGSAVRLVCLDLLRTVRDVTGDDTVDPAACRALVDAGRAELESEFALPDADGGLIPPDRVGTYSPHLVYGCSAQVVRLEVNVLTGELTVNGVVCAVDCGGAINPGGVIGQAEGGVAQGLGYAVMEEHVVTGGVPRTTSLENYLIPTPRDVPPIETILVQGDEPTGPMGAKGMAEVVIVPTAPAVAGAVLDAVGILPDRLPLTPERLLHAMEGRAERCA